MTVKKREIERRRRCYCNDEEVKKTFYKEKGSIVGKDLNCP